MTKYIKLVVKKVALVYIYPVYSYVCNNIGAQEQTVFALLLPVMKPVMKLAAKNWINTSVVNVDDLKPEIIVLNVECFHALYVIYSMQSATSTSTIFVLIAVDVFSLCVSLRRLNPLSKSLSTVLLEQRGQGLSLSSVKPSFVDTHQETRRGVPSAPTLHCSSAGSKKRLTLLEVAIYSLEIDGGTEQWSSINMQSTIQSLNSTASIVPAAATARSSATRQDTEDNSVAHVIDHSTTTGTSMLFDGKLTNN